MWEGYGPNSLTDLSLAWMQAMAQKRGLKLNAITPADYAWRQNPTDSFALMMNGWYGRFMRLLRPGDGRAYRRYNSDRSGFPAVNVTVDDSVAFKWHAPASNYRPATLTQAGIEPTGSR